MVSVPADNSTSSTTSEENLSFTVCLLSGQTAVFQGFSYDDRTSQLTKRVLSWVSGIQGIHSDFLKITLHDRQRILDTHQRFTSNELTDAMEITAIVTPAIGIRTEGDNIKMLFQFFLNEIRERGHLKQMVHCPRVSHDIHRLHQLWWIQFTKGISWCAMTYAEQRIHVRQWLFKQLSNDPLSQCMSPQPGAKRKKNSARWEGFDITDAELDVIVESMFSQYEAPQ